MMEIGIFLPTFGEGHTPEYLTELATAAEDVGAACLWAPEHVVLVDEYSSRYPYSEDGNFPVDPATYGAFGDPFAVLTFLAGRTKTIRLATGICLVPQRNPVYTAKMVASVDVLSGGRFDFGVGVGWLREEFVALGVDFERRGARTRAYLEVMKSLWTEDEASYEGELYRLPPVRFAPKPVQKPHPPILFGGESDAALRRAADLGQGWFGWNLDPDETSERLGHLDALVAQRDRSRDEMKIVICPYLKPAQDLDSLERYRDLGVDQVVCLLFDAATTDKVRGAVELLGEAIVEPARKL